MAAVGGLEPLKGISCIRSDRVLTMGAKERDNERPRGMFYRGPTVAPNVLTKIQSWHMSGWMLLRWAPRLHTLENDLY